MTQGVWKSAALVQRAAKDVSDGSRGYGLSHEHFGKASRKLGRQPSMQNECITKMSVCLSVCHMAVPMRLALPDGGNEGLRGGRRRAAAESDVPQQTLDQVHPYKCPPGENGTLDKPSGPMCGPKDELPADPGHGGVGEHVDVDR